MDSLLKELALNQIEVWVKDGKINYRAPKGALTEEVKRLLLTNKKQLIAYFENSIPIIERSGDLPLSFAQERMFFQYQLDPTSYNLHGCYRVNGPLDIEICKQTIEKIISRHEVLRTKFLQDGAGNKQVICKEAGINIEYEDLALTNAYEKMEMLEAKVREAFDFSKLPLIRVSIKKTGENEHLLQFVIPHIIADGWSLDVFKFEFATIYSAFKKGLPCPLPPLQVQYVDYAQWNRNFVDSKKEQMVNYWTGKLKDVPRLLLPADFKRPTSLPSDADNIVFTINSTLCNKIKKFTRDEGVTLFAFFISAYQVMLSRYSGQTDFAIGIPVASRNHHQLEPIIGFFVNILPLRMNISNNPSFRSLTNSNMLAYGDALDRQELPFEKIVESLNIARDYTYTPIVQTMFALNKSSKETFAVEELTFTAAKIGSGKSQFELILEVNQREESLEFSLIYNLAIFKASTINQFGRHFLNLLSEIIDNPDASINSYKLRGKAERDKVLHEWNDFSVPPVTGDTIHRIFSQQALKDPDRIAITYGDEHISYYDLNCKADLLAGHVRPKLCKGEGLAGIYIDRSIEMIIAVLAVLKAGGGYVPLDPANPPERLKYIIEDSNVSLILSVKKYLDDLNFFSGAIILTNELSNTEILPPGEPASVDIEDLSRNIAYVIYTSGSTGEPKGVIIEHRSVVNLIQQSVKLFSVTSSDRILQHASLNFDASVLEIFTALCSGATLVLAEKDDIFSPYDLAQQLKTQAITFLAITPSVLSVLPGAEYPALRTIVLGGESVSTSLLKKWKKGRSVFNVYAPTEGTVFSTIYKFPENEDVDTILLGRSIPNTQVFLLDKNNHIPPVGVVGEICLSGAGLSRGYIGQKAENEERFNFIDLEGNLIRYYRSGDYGKYDEEGNIAFVGREDSQVKIRGLRIELGEIEAVLNKDPEIIRFHLAIVPQGDILKALAVYVVPSKPISGFPQKIRAYLASHLPAFMIPDYIVEVSEIPLNANGKVDLNNLPEIGHTQVNDSMLPRNEMETKIINILKEILTISEISVFENFFNMGMHSLLASQFKQRLNETFGVTLSMSDIFHFSTVASLSERIIERQIENIETISLHQLLDEVNKA